MDQGARVGSLEAIRDFRAALHTFAQEARDAIDSYDMEIRRNLEWLLETKPEDWQQQVRHCEELVVAARIELERCRASKLPGGGQPSCMEEKKLYERAKRRLEYAQDKVEATRKWGHFIEKETAEYRGRASQLHGLFDADLPRAVAMLDRLLSALESYLAVQAPAASASTGIIEAYGTAAAGSAANPAATESPPQPENVNSNPPTDSSTAPAAAADTRPESKDSASLTDAT